MRYRVSGGGRRHKRTVDSKSRGGGRFSRNSIEGTGCRVQIVRHTLCSGKPQGTFGLEDGGAGTGDTRYKVLWIGEIAKHKGIGETKVLRNFSFIEIPVSELKWAN